MCSRADKAAGQEKTRWVRNRPRTDKLHSRNAQKTRQVSCHNQLKQSRRGLSGRIVTRNSTVANPYSVRDGPGRLKNRRIFSGAPTRRESCCCDSQQTHKKSETHARPMVQRAFALIWVNDPKRGLLATRGRLLVCLRSRLELETNPVGSIVLDGEILRRFSDSCFGRHLCFCGRCPSAGRFSGASS